MGGVLEEEQNSGVLVDEEKRTARDTLMHGLPVGYQARPGALSERYAFATYSE